MVGGAHGLKWCHDSIHIYTWGSGIYGTDPLVFFVTYRTVHCATGQLYVMGNWEGDTRKETRV